MAYFIYICLDGCHEDDHFQRAVGHRTGINRGLHKDRAGFSEGIMQYMNDAPKMKQK
jgi:hypothetical protein